jgi:ribosomal-protein-alanine N-acetyltransferase
MEPRLRATIPDDFEAIQAIEQRAFPNPWPPEAFTDFLLPWAFTLLLQDKIVGYIFYQGVEDEMVIINFAIDPVYQGRGWGELLLRDSLSIMRDTGVVYFYLDVRASNIQAKSLYQKYGFSEIGVRKNYYSLPDEDAIVMRKVLL